MNFNVKTQEKIRETIASCFNCEASVIDPKSLRDRGYNIVKVTYQQTYGSSGRSGHLKEIRKPQAPKESIFVLLRETGVQDHDGSGFTYSKYWVEIPKKMALSILALNHLPDLKSKNA